MADLKDTQFYELREVSESKKQFRLLLTPKQTKILLITCATVIGLIFIVLVVNLILGLSSKKPEQLQSATTQADSAMARALNDCALEADTEVCQARVRKNMAFETGQVAVCNGLVGDAFINCVLLIAFDKLDLSACETLEADDSLECTDHISLLIATQANSYSDCEKISNSDTKKLCQNQIIPFIVSENKCSEFGLDSKLCEKKSLAGIEKTGEPNECTELLNAEEFSACIATFSSRDSDRDGLNDWQEMMEIGTDFRVADTDSDGYLDGQEVVGGFDPLN